MSPPFCFARPLDPLWSSTEKEFPGPFPQRLVRVFGPRRGTWALRVVGQMKCQTFSVETSVNGGERDRMTSCDNRAKSQRGERNRRGGRIRDGAGAGFDQGPRLWRPRQTLGADTRATVGATVCLSWTRIPSADRDGVYTTPRPPFRVHFHPSFHPHLIRSKNARESRRTSF